MMTAPMRSMAIAALACASAGEPAHAQSGQGQPPKSVAPEKMQTWTPGLATYTDEVLFGDVWRRPGLNARDRSLVTISSLIAGGRSAQLTGHLGRALDNGVKPEEISGAITHLAFYSGWPTAVSALDVADTVLRQRGVDPSALKLASREKLAKAGSDADRAVMVARDVGPTAPGLAELTNGVLFDDLWLRSDLAPRDRSLVTIASLVTTGDAAQLTFHIRRGLENGLTQAEISEALTHLAFYAGWPKAMSAVPVAKAVFAEIGG